MASTKRRYSLEELTRRGDEMYTTQVRPHLTAEDDGKFVAIDIETGLYDVDADELNACRKLRTRVPDTQTWLVRIGYRAVHRFGGVNRREDP